MLLTDLFSIPNHLLCSECHTNGITLGHSHWCHTNKIPQTVWLINTGSSFPIDSETRESKTKVWQIEYGRSPADRLLLTVTSHGRAWEVCLHEGHQFHHKRSVGVSHCLDVSKMTYAFPTERHLGYFQFRAIMNKVVLNTCMCLCTSLDFNLFEANAPGLWLLGLLGSYTSVVL